MSSNRESESEGDLPFVSVIIPVYNDPEGIRRCLSALEEQTYPESNFEILAVDNGSTDETPSVIEEFSATLLVEDEVQGSYAARNTGIEHAEGDVLAFTDADCTPDPEWIEQGVETLDREDADMAAGRIVFEYTDEKSAAERYDASMNMRNDESVREGVAKTGNLFVRRRVVERVGEFPEQLRSGGDVHWTRSATGAGFTLVYAHEARVRHPSRQLLELLKKQYRVGKGQPQVWRLSGRSPVVILLVGLVRFPMTVVSFLFGSDEEDGDESGDDSEEALETPPDREFEQGIDVAVVAGLCLLSMTAGRIVGLVN